MTHTTIRISEENKRKLARFGDADESMNDALTHLLSEHDHATVMDQGPSHD